MEQQTKVEKLIPLQNKLKMKKKFVDIVELIINDVKKIFLSLKTINWTANLY
jgi:hypothetical protein